MARRPRIGSEIRAKVSVDLSSFTRALEQLSRAVRDKIVDEALFAGGEMIRRAAISRGPGPHIAVVKMSGKKLGSGSGTGIQKKNIRSTGSYVVIGPDREHWYYRFTELGTKDHSVTKRKRTGRQQALRRAKLGKEGRALSRSLSKFRPAIKFEVNGKTVFARRVRGFVAKPFMEPAAQGAGQQAMKKIGQVISREIEAVRS